MADLQSAVDRLVQHLKGTDNELKVSALKTVEETLASPSESQDGTLLLAILDSLKLALKSGNSRVSGAALSCGVALFESLGKSANDHGARRTLHTALSELVPAPGIIAYLGDNKETTRAVAGKAILAAGNAAARADRSGYDEEPFLSYLDKAIREQGFGSKNARTREQSLIYLTGLRKANPGLPLRGWSSLLVTALEDSDGTVRESARENVISIFTMPDVGSAARADLKKEMLKAGVRRTTSEAVLKGVLGGSASTSSPGSSINGDMPPGSMSMTKSSAEAQPDSVPSAAASKPAGRGERLLKKPKDMSNEAILADIEAQAAAAAPPPTETENDAGEVKVVYIASRKDLEQEFNRMLAHFEGKETEHNWTAREKAIFQMRGMLRAEVHSEYKGAFTSELKGIQDGIVKALLSLRTTLATTACHLVSELATMLKVDLDPLHETLSSTLLKMATLTKKSVAQLSQDALQSMIQHCAYHTKLLNLLVTSLDLKNAQARIYASSHLKTLLETQAVSHQQAITNTGGLESLQQAIKKCLSDANASVRDNGRSMYYLFTEIWPSQGQILLDGLDTGTKKQLERADPKRATVAAGSGAGIRTVSGASSNAGRPSIRAMINQRRTVQTSEPVKSLASNAEATSANDTTPQTTPAKRPTGFRDSGRPSSTSSRLVSSSNLPSAAPLPSAESSGSVYKSPSPVVARNPPAIGQETTPKRSSPSRTFSSRPGAHQSEVTAQLPPPSPTLQAMMMNNEYSTFEGYTMELANTVPLPNDLSTDDESVDIQQAQTPQARKGPVRQPESSTRLDARILDDLHDTAMMGNDSFEVDEAVKGRAEQAEQTAHRFLELVEPDEADNTILHVNGFGSPASQKVLSGSEQVAGSTGVQPLHENTADLSTPLLKCMADLHLKDSPANNGQHPNIVKAKSQAASSNWWVTKAKLEMGKAEPLPPALLAEIVGEIEARPVESSKLIRLARFSADYSSLGSEAGESVWRGNRLFPRMLDISCNLLRRDEEDGQTEAALILLMNLVTKQTNLLGGREGQITALLLDLRRKEQKNLTAAAQAVMQLFIAEMDTLYGLATLRTSLEGHLASHRPSDGKLDPGTASSYAMALDGFGRLFLDLPSEVLEDEIIRTRDLLKTALNDPTYAHLRQAAVSALSKANLVLQDDNRLFEIVGGLTKSQIHLCTYLFAREAAAARSD